uniref:Kinesin motor domain-containing protein n=1 Tax=Neogobius melanostomus TaxID=47308 RepID=A0A8C6T9L7_9GOBI
MRITSEVAVRIRPLLAKEVLHRHQVCVRVVPGSSQVMLGSDRLFSFEHAFGPESSQDQVYEACVRPLLDTLLEGYNATVFCYGQTGSGKTYTLEGGSLGTIYRKITKVFIVHISYLELYKEELRDLLELPTVHKPLHIREDNKGNTGKHNVSFQLMVQQCVIRVVTLLSLMIKV